MQLKTGNIVQQQQQLTSQPSLSSTGGIGSNPTTQTLRLVSGGSTNTTPIRVLTSGQTVRLQTSQSGATTILRGQTTIMTTTSLTPNVIGGPTTTSATIGGKQILLQKPISLSGQNLLQLVKTSQGKRSYDFNF